MITEIASNEAQGLSDYVTSVEALISAHERLQERMWLFNVSITGNYQRKGGIGQQQK